MTEKTDTNEPYVIIHFDEDGNARYRKSPGCRLLLIDDRSPSDRVYEYTSETNSPISDFVLEDEVVDAENVSDETMAKLLKKDGRLN